MKKLVIKVKIVADGMVHHVTKTFMQFQVFLAAIMAIMTFQYSSAIQTIIFFAIMFFHDLTPYQICCVACFNDAVCLYLNTKGKTTAITNAYAAKVSHMPCQFLL